MKRANRQYALVDVLRAISPRTKSARSLAADFSVSTRTIERDISALQEAGVPIYGSEGRNGGYAIMGDYSLPPLQFTDDEAVSILGGLTLMLNSPFRQAAFNATYKLLAALPQSTRVSAELLLNSLYVLDELDSDEELQSLMTAALTQRRVLSCTYMDDSGRVTERSIEPLGLLSVRGNWIIVAWCRLRHAIRGFRIDWIHEAELTTEVAPQRDPELLARDLRRWSFAQSPVLPARQ